MSEQTELRALADHLELRAGARPPVAWTWRGIWQSDIELLRRAADRLDRLTALVARLELEGDA